MAECEVKVLLYEPSAQEKESSPPVYDIRVKGIDGYYKSVGNLDYRTQKLSEVVSGSIYINPDDNNQVLDIVAVDARAPRSPSVLVPCNTSYTVQRVEIPKPENKTDLTGTLILGGMILAGGVWLVRKFKRRGNDQRPINIEQRRRERMRSQVSLDPRPWWAIGPVGAYYYDNYARNQRIENIEEHQDSVPEEDAPATGWDMITGRDMPDVEPEQGQEQDNYPESTWEHMQGIEHDDPPNDGDTGDD